MANNRNRRTPIRPGMKIPEPTLRTDIDPIDDTIIPCPEGHVRLWGVCYSEDTTNLDLSFWQLTGYIHEIPPEIGQLTNLTHLRLSQNQLTGQIPPEIGQLANLYELDLSNSGISGQIPSEIGQLANLSRLYLGNTHGYSGPRLSGEIPSEIGNLTSLEYLFLNRNELTGEIPPEIGNLTGLKRLLLDRNQLTGSIPSEINNTDLNDLDLSHNQLSGEIPELPNLGLQTFYLNNNQLTGSIPNIQGSQSWLTFAPMGGHSSIKINLSHNELTGEIPSGIYHHTGTNSTESNISVLRLHHNQLSGEISPDIGNLTNLNNQGTDTWPQSSLALSNNELTGTIPMEICDVGSVPLGIGGSGYITPRLHENRLCGPYPTCLGEVAINVLPQDQSQCGDCGGIIDECGMCWSDYSGGCFPSTAENTPGACCSCGDFDIYTGTGSFIYNDCLGICDADSVVEVDCTGECGGNAVLDCFGECDGPALIDECGVCDGPGYPYTCTDGTPVCTLLECDNLSYGCTNYSTPHTGTLNPIPGNYNEHAVVFDGTCDYGNLEENVCGPFVLYLVVDTTESMFTSDGPIGLIRARQRLEYYQTLEDTPGFPCGFGVISIKSSDGTPDCETNILSLDDAIDLLTFDSECSGNSCYDDYLDRCNSYGNNAIPNFNAPALRTRRSMIPPMHRAYQHLMNDEVISDVEECSENPRKIINIITDDDGMIGHCKSIWYHDELWEYGTLIHSWEIGDGNVCTDVMGPQGTWEWDLSEYYTGAPCLETEIQDFRQSLIDNDVKVYFDFGTDGTDIVSPCYEVYDVPFDYRSMIFHFGPHPNFVYKWMPFSNVDECQAYCEDTEANNVGELCVDCHSTDCCCDYSCMDTDAINYGANDECEYLCPAMIVCWDYEFTPPPIKCCGYTRVLEPGPPNPNFRWIWTGCHGPECPLGGRPVDSDGDGYYDYWEGYDENGNPINPNEWNHASPGPDGDGCTDPSALNCTCYCSQCFGCPETSGCSGNHTWCTESTTDCEYPSDPCESNEGWSDDFMDWGNLGLTTCPYPTDELHCAYSLNQCCEDPDPITYDYEYGCLNDNALNYKCGCDSGTLFNQCTHSIQWHNDGCCNFEYLTGDVNMDGRVDINDVVIILNHILDISILDGQSLLNADINNDGEINIADVVDILQNILNPTATQQAQIINELNKLTPNIYEYTTIKVDGKTRRVYTNKDGTKRTETDDDIKNRYKNMLKHMNNKRKY
jgi:hypothetical protein